MSDFSLLSPLLQQSNKMQAGRLQAFRERCVTDYVEREGLLYRVWELGAGVSQEAAEKPKEGVLFLPGGMGFGEIWFPFMLEMGGKYRCMAVSMPECKSAEQYVDAVAGIMAERGLERAVVVGQSVGGLMAQLFARRHPAQTTGLALCMTGAASEGLPAAVRQKWARRANLRLRMTVMPFNVVRRGLAREAFVRNCPDQHYDRLTFWRDYMMEIYEHHIYKKQYIAVNTIIMPNLYRKHRWKRGELGFADDRVMILYSDADTTFGEGERQALYALYPGANRVDIGDGGQISLHAFERQAIDLIMGHTAHCLNNDNV